MKTTYFANIKNLTNDQQRRCVSIARSVPPGFNWMEKYPLLYPPVRLLNWWKGLGEPTRGHEQMYVNAYHYQVLKHLNTSNVVSQLGNDAILVCWEGKGKFCHRRIVAEWLQKKLNIEVPEL